MLALCVYGPAERELLAGIVISRYIFARGRTFVNDQHIIAVATIVQDCLLLLSAFLIAWYLWETRKMRKAAEDQVHQSQALVSTSQEQLEAQIRPALTLVIGEGGSLCVSNIGSGAALNLRLVKTKEESIDWGAKSNFGAPAMGMAVAVDHSVNTGSAAGSYGNIIGERLHLTYESLSGRVYASIVLFDGNGRPSGVRFVPKG
jgi:hypothetical protein